MYARIFQNKSHTRRFSITPKDPSGWDVREERDEAIVRNVHYDDWHRVERARRSFAIEAAMLFEQGWTEGGYSTKR
jgi:hypothetical protein